MGRLYICKVEWGTMTGEGLLMYIWGQNVTECYGLGLGKRGSPWNVTEGELVSMGYISRRFWKGYKAREQEGNRLGLWWVLVASTAFHQGLHKLLHVLQTKQGPKTQALWPHPTTTNSAPSLALNLIRPHQTPPGVQQTYCNPQRGRPGKQATHFHPNNQQGHCP